MGMFDTVIYHGKEYQTKDFDNLMEEYRITDEGRLVKDEWHLENVPKAEQPFPDAPEGSLESICGTLRRVIDQKDVDTHYHGLVYFYGDGESFIAKFTDGQLVAIEHNDD